MISLGAAVGLLSCSSGQQNQNAIAAAAAAQAPIPVTIASVTQKTVPVEIDVIGTGEAYSTVTIMPLVDGTLQAAHFTQGQDVRAGQLLFSIDARPFQAQLQQAQSNLARDTAQMKYAQDQLARNQQLYAQGIISAEQDQQFKSNAEASEASVRADEAAVKNAQISLGYCSIYSPIDGRTGALLVHPGNTVKNNTTAMVVINKITPLYEDFSVPEQYLSQIKQYQAQRPLPVEAALPGDQARPERGALQFINNTVDAQTGTILLKASFPNASRRLWPGQFVNITLRLTSQRNAVVAPSAAVETGQQGQYVFLVKPDKTVDLRPVKTGMAAGGDTVIESGLRPGDTVVTDGQVRLFPGAKVQIKQGLGAGGR